MNTHRYKLRLDGTGACDCGMAFRFGGPNSRGRVAAILFRECPLRADRQARDTALAMRRAVLDRAMHELRRINEETP